MLARVHIGGPTTAVRIQNSPVRGQCPGAAPLLATSSLHLWPLATILFVFLRMSYKWKKLCWVKKPALSYFIVLNKDSKCFKTLFDTKLNMKKPFVNKTFYCQTPPNLLLPTPAPLPAPPAPPIPCHALSLNSLQTYCFHEGFLYWFSETSLSSPPGLFLPQFPSLSVIFSQEVSLNMNQAT